MKSPSRKFRRTIKRLQSRVASCRKTIERLWKQQRELPPSIAKALGVVRPFVTEEVFSLLCAHVRVMNRGQGKRLPAWLKKFALHLNFRGPRAYRFLAPIFCLPMQRSLRHWLGNIRMSPGVIPGVIECVSACMQIWDKRDRVCSLIFGEVILKKLSYDVTQDLVQGFADDGTARTPDIADRAMVVLLAGVPRRWVQPIAFTIGHVSTPGSVTKDLLA
uniref:Transposase n=1 Tax=Rhipicephalus appendiculatus TaxID=34631 RepID=A0A131YK61_RHIAP